MNWRLETGVSGKRSEDRVVPLAGPMGGNNTWDSSRQG